MHPKINNATVDGWAIYDAEEEYKRMGVPCDEWRMTTINESYEVIAQTLVDREGASVSE